MRYVIDVTQLVHWHGNLTGIPRVMDELSLRFLQDPSKETVFVSWVKELGKMCEVDLATSRAQRGKGIRYIKNGASIQAEPTTTDASAVQATSLGYMTKKVAKKVAAKSRFDRTGLYKKALNVKRNLELQSYNVYEPLKGDKFFIPWGEWWDKNWLKLIKSFSGQSVDIYPVCHDILPMVVPQFSGNSASLVQFVEQIFPIATKVLAVSQTTKRDLAKWMKDHDLPVPSIEVFRNGEDFTIKKSSLNTAELQKKYAVEPDNYLLYVSTIEPRKNHALLYYTYKLAAEKGIELPRLLIVGRVGHDVSEIISLIRHDSEVNSKLSIENNVDDDDLNWLYQNCKFTVMPSFYEGWGMSVIESIARGKSAIISNTSSLNEMPDTCVIRFNPASSDECLAAIQEMSQPAVLASFRKEAKAYPLHSWDQSYQQVIAILGE